MENKIEIHNMNLHYGDFHALHDINLDIKENEITAFIGPSGCGKSTLSQNAQPHERSGAKAAESRATCMLDGRGYLQDTVTSIVLRRRVGMVFQKPNPFPMSDL